MSNQKVIYTAYEYVNKEITDKLIYLNYSDYEKMINKVNDREEDEEQNNIWNNIQYKRIINYCKEAKKNNYKIKQNYIYAFNSNNGRLFVNNDKLKNAGLQNINRYFRGLLCNGLYNDYDMINAHPNILRYYCEKNNIKCSNLYNYTQNRDEIIDELINETGKTRYEIKTLFLKMINSSYEIKELKKIKNKFLKEFNNEIKNIQNNIFNNNLNLVNELRKRGIKENLKGKLLNHILCNLENEILNLAINELDKKYNIKPDVLCFDGFLLNKNLKSDDIINFLNNTTIKYNIKWDKKEHNIILYDDVINLSGNYKNYIVANDMVDLTKQILNNHLKDKLFLNKGLDYYYLYNDIFINNKEEIKVYLFKWLIEQDIYLVKNDKQIPLNNKVSDVRELANTLIDVAPSNNNLLNDIWEDTVRKLYWNNGYFDFKLKKFITDKSKFKTLNKINYDLNLKSNPKVREEIIKKIFAPIFGVDELPRDEERFQLMEFFLHRLARIMAGCYEDKIWISLKGERDCGKGVISDLLSKCFDSYVATVSTKNFIAKNNNNGNADLENKFCIKFMFKRLAICQEMPRNNNFQLSSSAIKGFVSGGDNVEARDVFDKQTEKKYKVQSSLMMCMNDSINSDETDVFEKLEQYNFESKFINSDYDGLKLSNIKYYEKDDEIKSVFLNRQDVINEFALLLIDYYYKTDLKYPLSIKKKNNNEDFDKLTLEKQLNIIFEQGTTDDILTLSDVKANIKKYNIKGSQQNINKKLDGLFNIERYKSNSEYKYKGLKIKNDE